MMPETIGQPARWPATVNSFVERTRKPDTNALSAMTAVTIATPKIIPICKDLSRIRRHD
jgi:hypothetical protein